MAYAGAVPLIACAVMPLFGYHTINTLGSLDYVARVYGLVIVSFMAGVHWGTYLYQRESAPVNLLITSNALTIAVWIIFLSAGPGLTLLALIAAFVGLLVIDYHLRRAELIPADYFQMRVIVTTIVVLALLIIFILM